MKIFSITDMKDYYYILGVHSKATIQDIKSAFRKLAIRLHPDKNAGDKFFEERFKDIKGHMRHCQMISGKAIMIYKVQVLFQRS